jgi:hypothetical protein
MIVTLIALVTGGVLGTRADTGNGARPLLSRGDAVRAGMRGPLPDAAASLAALPVVCGGVRVPAHPLPSPHALMLDPDDVQVPS